MGRLFRSVGLEKGPERGLKTISFKPKLPVIYANSADPDQTPSPGFTDKPLYIALWRNSDKNSAAIMSHLTRGMISLVNGNHVDNNLKEILVYVYLRSNNLYNLPKQIAVETVSKNISISINI